MIAEDRGSHGFPFSSSLQLSPALISYPTNMPRLPEPLARLVAAFSRLPGVGPKTALRYAYHVLGRHPVEAEQFSRALAELHRNMKRCSMCFLDSERDPCVYCSDSARDQGVLCVVATSRDLHAVEASGSYRGRYHVLRGLLDALEGIGPESLTINQLKSRLHTEPIKEVILALNPDIPGESTSLFLSREIASLGLRVTKLARGLQTGSDLEYVDPLTLGDALEGRREV